MHEGEGVGGWIGGSRGKPRALTCPNFRRQAPSFPPSLPPCSRWPFLWPTLMGDDSFPPFPPPPFPPSPSPLLPLLLQMAIPLANAFTISHNWLTKKKHKDEVRGRGVMMRVCGGEGGKMRGRREWLWVHRDELLAREDVRARKANPRLYGVHDGGQSVHATGGGRGRG